MFSNEERRWPPEKSKFQLLGLLHNYFKHSRRLLISFRAAVSAFFLENPHSKLSLWNGAGACAATKPCCRPPVCKLGPAGRKTWRAQHYGAKENWSSPFLGWRVLVSPVSSLRGTCFQPLRGFWALSLIFRAPRGPQVLKSQQWDVLWPGT